MSRKLEITEPTPAAQLGSFIAAFDAQGQKLFRSLRTAMRRRFPGANELVYDYGHSLVIAYAPTERGIEATVSIALRTDGVRLYLMHGPQLNDPARLLRGTGKETRFVRVESAKDVERAEVKALINAASALATIPIPGTGKGRLIIQSSVATRQPRVARRAPAK